MDKLSRKQRSALMAKIRSKNTKPELFVRRLAHRLGFRFRLHKADLPGRPDLVFARLRKVVFVNGCFWHAHQCPHGKRIPAANRDYWIRKRRRNSRRDRMALMRLQNDGWVALTIWECELAEPERLARRLWQFLAGSRWREP